MSRQTVITEPALPAECMICKRSANGVVEFIDFNFDQDFYGAVVICKDCITESHEALGFVQQELLEVATETIVSLELKLKAMTDDLDSYRSIVDSLSSVRSDLVAPAEKPQEPVEPIGEPSKSAESTESESDESDSSGGPENLPESGNSNLFG